MKPLTPIMGAAAFGLAALAGAQGSFTFEGKAAYCVSHRDETATCVKINADMQITAEQNISEVWVNAYRTGRNPMKTLEQKGRGKTMHYVTNNEMCIFGNVTAMSLTARDVQDNQAEFAFEEVDCATLDGMMNQ